MKRWFCVFLCSLLLAGCLTACNDLPIENDTPPDMFPSQSAPVTLQAPDAFQSTVGDWGFWTVDEPYIADSLYKTEYVTDTITVALTKTGFDYEIQTISDALKSDEEIAARYDFAETLLEEHDGGAVAGVGSFMTYYVTSSVNGLLKENHDSFAADYDDLTVYVAQDFSRFVSPSAIGMTLWVDDLTEETQAFAYHVLSVTFGPDFAQYLICQQDSDGKTNDDADITKGNLDDQVTVGECKYRFTRTIESADDDGYLIFVSAQMDETPVENEFWYYNTGYVSRYETTPVSLGVLLEQPEMSEYMPDDFDLSFEDYFRTYSQTLTGYEITLPGSISYYEMHSDSDENVYSLQCELYGAGTTVSDDLGQYRGFQASYLVQESDGNASVMLYLTGQTTAQMFEGELSDADISSLSNGVLKLASYFLPDAEWTRGEDQDDVRVYTTTVTLLDKEHDVTLYTLPVQEDGSLWVEWELYI